jgi:hypothetical protein
MRPFLPQETSLADPIRWQKKPRLTIARETGRCIDLTFPDARKNDGGEEVMRRTESNRAR